MRQGRAFLIGFLEIAGFCAAAERPKQCRLELPVYDAHGNRLRYTLHSVKARGVDLLKMTDPKFRVLAGTDLLMVPETLVSRLTELDLGLQIGSRVVERAVKLLGCPQKVSIVDGSLAADAVGTSLVVGRLTGCDLSGDWWIRAAPMFGIRMNRDHHEGVISPTDGRITMISSFDGVRHMVIVGKAKLPVKALAIDITEGGANDLGVIDLKDACPK